jgi:hypothetical protein
MWASIVTSLVPILNDVLKKVIKDPVELQKVQNEMTNKLLEQEASITKAMTDVMTADSASTNKLVSSARPIVVYWALGMITLITFLGVFGLAGGAITALAGVPDPFWTFLTVGIGAFSVTRGMEKSIREWKKGDGGK